MSIFKAEIQNTNNSTLKKNIKLSNETDRFIKKKNIQKQIKKISHLLKFPEKELSIFLSKKIFFNICEKSSKLRLNILNIKYLYFLIYPLFLINFKKKSKKKKSYKYIIDNIGNNIELNLYKNLEHQEKSGQIIYLSENKNLKGKNIIYYDFYNVNFNFSDLIVYYKIFFYSLKLTFATKINFLYLILSFLKEYYFSKSLFYFHNAKFLLTHKHYDTSNIKKFFFKKFGGKIYATIQKNISTTNSNSFFYNADLNFSFAERVGIPTKKRYSSLIKNISVGSFFMENLFLNKKNATDFSNKQIEEYDILYLAGNDLHPTSNFDSWKGHNIIYKEHLEWLKRASLEFPAFKFGFKHHPGKINRYEEIILKDSKVIIINSKINSYELAAKSKLALSFASTMVIELLSLGIKSFFLNPGYKNEQFLHDITDHKKISIANYSSLKMHIMNLSLNMNINKYDYCQNSKKVTKKIISYLNNI
jgi:hypothetical protein